MHGYRHPVRSSSQWGEEVRAQPLVIVSGVGVVVLCESVILSVSVDTEQWFPHLGIQLGL